MTMSNEEARPDPDELLERIEREKPRRAKLKIFFGMSAGVGKTYAMLKEARLVLERGGDVAIGWVETHGRKETDALVEGIERIPPRTVEYRGIRLSEMDLDAVLKRKPSVVIVDELAHSNAPGSRHPKRYQDVLEILDAGIEVYTAVNIQHLESMADSVELVTFVPIKERVPDSVFDRADEIQMVDIPPEELIKRLEEGKVYTGEASREAVGNFFTKSNLAVLREIALRQASLLAGHQLLEIMRGDSGRRSSGAAPTILVAVSPSPTSESLIRWARRLTYSLKAEWHCINVETGIELSEEDKERLEKNMGLARGLGARVSSVPNVDVAAGVLDYARKYGVSMIVIGKRGITGARGLLSRRSITDRIVAGSGDISVFAVQDRPVREPLRKRTVTRLKASPTWQYLAALGAIAALTPINLLLAGGVGYWAASVPYLAAISLLALLLDRGPVVIAAFLSAALWNFLFIPPRFTFTIARPEDWLMLALYFVLALSSGWATGRLRANQAMLVVRESRMAILGELASELAGTSGIGAIVASGVAFLEKAFEAEVIIMLKDAAGRLKGEPEGGWMALDAKTLSAARYCFSSGRSAGRYTSTLGAAEWHFVPMDTPGGIIGVVGLRTAEGTAWTTELESFLRTMSRTVSLAVQREVLAEENKAAALDRESERLAKLLLDSVSHELRTPLTVIEGSASALADDETARDDTARRALVAEIIAGTGRLNGIVENLLSMSRLESGHLVLERSEADPEELLAAAVKATQAELKGMDLRVEAIPGPGTPEGEGLQPVFCDAGLIVQVLVNLLRNSGQCAGEGSRIWLEARESEGCTAFAVRDDGPGANDSEMQKLFSKFYRGERASPGGAGLGLAICKGLVEAHGGSISARNWSGGGLSVEFTLPRGPVRGSRRNNGGNQKAPAGPRWLS
jgi:two-component system sensor histidine kinase KdpD